jgi:hypothetical protein
LCGFVLGALGCSYIEVYVCIGTHFSEYICCELTSSIILDVCGVDAIGGITAISGNFDLIDGCNK